MGFWRKLLDIPPKPTPAEIDQQLREIFDFTDADLKANHDGRMSSKQHYWFIDKLLRTVLLAIAITVAGGWLLFSIVQGREPFGLWQISPIPLFLGFALVVWIIFSGVKVWQLLIDVMTQKVDVVIGKGRVHRYWYGRDLKRYGLVIKNEGFAVTKKAASFLNDDEYYTVFFTVRSRVILSIEVG